MYIIVCVFVILCTVMVGYCTNAGGRGRRRSLSVERALASATTMMMINRVERVAVWYAKTPIYNSTSHSAECYCTTGDCTPVLLAFSKFAVQAAPVE